jgi:acetyl/propionyl-CoA carboxylase alpha subunit
MHFSRVLIANRGEIAIRIARAVHDLGLCAVAMYATDDAASLHIPMADDAYPLTGRGVPAYLDIDGIITAAQQMQCDAIHPGYGFLAESGTFARRCQEAGLVFIGPAVDILDLFGDKGRARAAATAADVPIMRGIDRPVSVTEAQGFFTSLGHNTAMIIKALAGGGGRGTRVVQHADAIAETYARCQSEAASAFGNGVLYVEEFLPRARHIEVQILGDHYGHIVDLGERECSVQRRYQKLIEIAPAPHLPERLRRQIIDAALRLARSVHYTNLGTIEFLVDCASSEGEARFFFIEANARLQVEHTVTEAVTGVDIVQAQIRLAAGASLAELSLDNLRSTTPRGYAVQTRVNLETLSPDGSVRPTGGILTAYEAPSGPGVRTDGFGYTGYVTSPAYDSLLAKVIAHSPSPHFADAVARASRALSEFRIDGVATNIPFLQRVLQHADFTSNGLHTRWVDEHIADLAREDGAAAPRRWVAPAITAASVAPRSSTAPVRLDSTDPLALFEHDRRVKAVQATTPGQHEKGHNLNGPDGSVGLPAPIQGTIVRVAVSEGDVIHQGQELVVMEAMKMEHVIEAASAGIVRRIEVSVGDIIVAGHPLIFIEEADVGKGGGEAVAMVDPDFIRPDLAEVYARHAFTRDEHRPDAVAKRQARGFRMPRENVAQLVDAGTFKEYGPLVVALQHQRYDAETLRKNTPADGLIAGIGMVNGAHFGDERARTMVIAYDYTVLAGTQGRRNHYKQDRMFELARRFRLPVVIFTEGGGGRPGDDDTGPRVAFDTHTFTQFSQLSGLVPLIGVTNGRCFAGNTALLGCCDVIIATEGSTVAMGGPAMIEGGGLGVYTPEEVGPMSFQVPNGVVDILVKDEAEAVETAKQYLSYFQGAIDTWEAPDQRRLRHIVPENRLRLYNMREVIATLADTGSILEIREKFGVGVITAFIRIEGRPLGVIANNPYHLAGAIDSDGADKGARFLQLCDAFDIPVLSLMDCPGIMVGPEAEATALVRHSARLFNTGANLTTPLFSVVVRKAYGLGVQAMCGGSSFVGFLTVAWPTAEFAGMNIEGAVKLGYRKELAAIADPQERLAEYERRVARAYDRAKAANASAGYGIDDVIDPADTRAWLVMGLRSRPPVPPRGDKKYPYIDTW